ncbi:MAG: substrate-binding domain-containing protein, partial [Rhodospirillales bacterium]|nr:substrate-binding domain-containing protein [Acetobacter sp.]
GVRLVDVEGAGQTGLWEDLAGRDPQTLAGIARNIAVSVKTSAEAIEKWKADQPELDAWITYASWHELLKEQTDLVTLPEAQTLYRGTPAALAANTKHHDEAARFLVFLQSEEAHKIFQKWGWK